MATIETRDRWETPWEVVNAVSRRLGRAPTIDLASTPENAKAGIYVTETGVCAPDHEYGIFYGHHPIEGGLFGLDAEDIAGDVDDGWAWLNPPYSQGNMDRFLSWSAQYVDYGGTVAVCHRSDFTTRWFHEHILDRLDILLIPPTRTKFLPPEGVKPSTPNFGAVISVMGGKRRGIVERLEL